MKDTQKGKAGNMENKPHVSMQEIDDFLHFAKIVGRYSEVFSKKDIPLSQSNRICYPSLTNENVCKILMETHEGCRGNATSETLLSPNDLRNYYEGVIIRAYNVIQERYK